MAANKFHLGWFIGHGFGVEAWNNRWGSAAGPDWTGGFYVDMCRAMERAGFDFALLEDTCMVSDVYGGTMEGALKHAVFAPKHDPVPLIPLMSQATKHLGVVATLSTSFYLPWPLARLCNTLDHVTQGRFGWNIVTSGEDLAAQNFGLDAAQDHDVRYEIADEFMEVVHKLWESWDADAVVLDRESGTYADYKKVRTIDHVGKYFKCRGPLNTVPSPQRKPVMIQAGGSPKGRDFAAQHADAIVTIARGVEGMKEYRDDVRARMEKFGRKPDDCKVLFCVEPILADTDEEAWRRHDEIITSEDFVMQRLIGSSSNTEVDFSQFDLDKPLPPVSTNGEQTSLKHLTDGGGTTKTLRELVQRLFSPVELVGTPETVAKQMDELMEEVGGDGFLLLRQGPRLTRRYVDEICDGLVPALQRRGVVRTSYTYDHFRDNLLEF